MEETTMNLKFIIFTLLLGASCIFSTHSFAQTDIVQENKEKQAAIEENERNGDRLKVEVQKNEVLKNEARKSEGQKSENRLNDAENLQKENKAIAKEASRINKDASKARKSLKWQLKQKEGHKNQD
jgi:hypothetical protein